MKRTLSTLLLTGLVLLLGGCGGADGDKQETEAPAEAATAGIDAEVEAYYAANPDFFGFKTLADLPPDLVWTSNDHLPEIGSPEAKKGGTQYGALQDFPRTLRTVGPDANDAFRTYLQDDVGMSIAGQHPETLELYPGLAEAWAVDWDTQTVYIKLDPAATWSDGQPITADDYQFMFWFYRSPYIMEPWYNNFYSTTYTNITPGWHFSFLGLCTPDAPAKLEAEGEDPICDDPEGAERSRQTDRAVGDIEREIRQLERLA